jgi:hypothetical protein
MADNLGARKNSSWKAVCTAPDFCKTPVGSSTPPIPYQVMADLGQSAKTVPSVRFNGDPCLVLDQSIVPKCTGDEPGTAKGVKSGTVAEKVEPTSASSTVRAGRKKVVRHLDTCTLNSGNCTGIYTAQPAPGGTVGTGGRPTGANPTARLDTANELQAAREKKGIWGMVSGPVHFVLGAAGFVPGLGAVPDLLDAGVYVLEGDMISAGASAAAALPIAGDAAKAATLVGKAGKQAARVAAEKAAKEAAEKVARETAERLAKEAAERAAKEAAEKAAKEAVGKKINKEAGEAAAVGVQKGDGIKVRKSRAKKPNEPKPRQPRNYEKKVVNEDGSVTYTLKNEKGELVEVTYKNGYPDFSPVTYEGKLGKAEAEIEMTGKNSVDFSRANEKAGFGKGAYDHPDGYTWHHHQDGKTMQLVKTDVHGAAPHTGGASAARVKSGGP